MAKNRLKRSVRVTLIGLVVNTSLATVKLAAGLIGHSHALVADAVESLADVFSSLVVWRGIVVASVPADEDHPYGHGKAEPLAAALVSSLLLLAAVWIAVTAIGEIRQPHETPATFTLAVLVMVIVVKESLFRFVLKESSIVESSAVHADAWHHRSDAITSAAAFVGISIAVFGGPGFESADDYAAIAAAGIIAFNGWRLLRNAIHELMDRSPSQEFISKVRTVAETTPGVGCIEKCLVRKMGYHHFVDLHVQVDPEMSVRLSHDIAHQVKSRILEQLPVVSDVLVHIEPLGHSDQPGG